MVGGWVPFPGTKTVLAVFFVNLIAALGAMITFRIWRAGLLMIHLGLVLLVATGALTHWLAVSATLRLAEGQSSAEAITEHQTTLPLPLTVTLLDAERINHPNTSTPKHFRSRVRLSSPDGFEREALIAMNQPLRFGAFTIYQSGFSIGTGAAPADESVFAVVRNPVGPWPAMASGLTVLGLALHFGAGLIGDLRTRRKRLAQPSSPAKTACVLSAS